MQRGSHGVLVVNGTESRSECQAAAELPMYFYVRELSGSSRNLCQCDHAALCDVCDLTDLMHSKNILLSSVSE